MTLLGDDTPLLNKNEVRQSFSLAAHTYDGLAHLQRTAGLDLVSKTTISGVDNVIVDLGCGTGFITQELLSKVIAKQIIAIDIALPMLQIAKAKFEQNKMDQPELIQYLCADLENLPLYNHSVDVIVSNLALQWCQNPASVFNHFHEILKQNGQIFLSTFGPSTLQELKKSWATVDSFTHVNDFYSANELDVFLRQNRFRNIKIETTLYHSGYQTIVELMKELKGIGANHVSSGKNKKLTRKSHMKKMIDHYEKIRKNGVIPATYEIITASAQK